MKLKIAILLFCWAVAVLILSSFIKLPAAAEQMPACEQVATTTPKVVFNAKEHRRETWITALEWCESAGRLEAINKVDVDGTSSYYSFQFKPATFKNYAIKYGILEAGLSPATYREKMKEYELQRAIVRKMIDDKSVNWYQQFPDCVKRKIGLPPR